MGVVTRADVALALLNQRPTFLFAAEQLEGGDGLSLVQHAHSLQRQLKIPSAAPPEVRRCPSRGQARAAPQASTRRSSSCSRCTLVIRSSRLCTSSAS